MTDQKSRLWRVARFVVAALALLHLSAQPALAQSVLRDAETEALFAEISAPIIKVSGLDKRNVRILLIGDPSVNAFTAGGQDVFINSGLLAAAENANEVQGVIAHELGHVAGGHVLRGEEGAKTATGIMLLSLLLGAAAMAAGAPASLAPAAYQQISRLLAGSGSDSGFSGANLSDQKRHQRKGDDLFLQKASGSGIPLWRADGGQLRL
jgi:predicted Zn-dependent protease